MDQTILSRVDIGRQPYFLQTSLFAGGQEGFRLTLTDALNAWTGEVTEDDIGPLAKKVNMDKEEFIELTKKALTQMDVGNLTFEYKADDMEDGDKEFSWKKIMTTGNIKFQLGCLQMTAVEDPSETIQDMFIFSIGHMSKLRGDIHRLETENERLSTERSNALKRLEKCVTLKEDLEQDLYSKFQIVLNDKKAKIRSLKEQAVDAKHQLQDALENVPSTTQTGPLSGGAASNRLHDDDDGSEEVMDMSDPDTDDERKKTRASQRRKKTTAVPQRESDEDSLALGDDDDQPVQATKRRRRREPAKKETGNKKPAIPRVSSNSTPGRTPGRTPSMQRSRSSRSNKQSPDKEPEDLYEDL